MPRMMPRTIRTTDATDEAGPRKRRPHRAPSRAPGGRSRRRLTCGREAGACGREREPTSHTECRWGDGEGRPRRLARGAGAPTPPTSSPTARPPRWAASPTPSRPPPCARCAWAARGPRASLGAEPRRVSRPSTVS